MPFICTSLRCCTTVVRPLLIHYSRHSQQAVHMLVINRIIGDPPNSCVNGRPSVRSPGQRERSFPHFLPVLRLFFRRIDINKTPPTDTMLNQFIWGTTGFDLCNIQSLGFRLVGLLFPGRSERTNEVISDSLPRPPSKSCYHFS